MESQIACSRQWALSSRNLFTRCSAPYGHMTCNQQRGKCHSCSQFIKMATNLRLIRPHTVAYTSAVRWLNFFEGILISRSTNLQKPTAHSQKTNLVPDLADRSTMQYTVCYPSYNTSNPRKVSPPMSPFATSRPPSQASTEEISSHYCARKILYGECGSMSGKDFK